MSLLPNLLRWIAATMLLANLALSGALGRAAAAAPLKDISAAVGDSSTPSLGPYEGTPALRAMESLAASSTRLDGMGQLPGHITTHASQVPNSTLEPAHLLTTVDYVNNGQQAAPWRRRLAEQPSLLGQKISSADLDALDLSLHRQPGDPHGTPPINTLGCRGAVCPEWGECGTSGLRACHIPNLEDTGTPSTMLSKDAGEEGAGRCPQLGDFSAGQLFLPGCRMALADAPASPWAAQVVRLKNVFVNSEGVVFNATHRFFPGGCLFDPSIPLKFSYGLKTKVVHHQRIINLSVGSHARHRIMEMIERLPLFLSLAPFLPHLSANAKFFLGESKLLANALGHILGPSPRARAAHISGKDQLIFAQTLYQPLHSSCNIPSPSAWASLRHTFLLPPDGLPLFTPGWSLRLPLPSDPVAAQRPTELPDSWAVVLALPPSAFPISLNSDFAGYYGSDQSLESLVQSQFWFGRVETFTWDSDKAHTKDLFNRAALIITTAGAAMAQMAFMPPGGVVLLLELGRALPKGVTLTSGGMTAQIRNFARACGLSVGMLMCQPQLTEAGSVLCSRRKFLSLLTWASERLYRSPILPGASWRHALPSSIPGSGLRTARAVEAFKDWSRCAAARGKWVLDAQPRPLPWPFHGHLERCDKNHILDVEGGMAGRMADDVALTKDPASWKVRPGIKYRWNVSPEACPSALGDGGAPWVAFSRDEFCHLGRGGAQGPFRIVVLGDSIQAQLTEALAQNVLAGVEKPAPASKFRFGTPQECQDWLKGANVPHQYCLKGEFGAALCRGLQVEYIRNDLLDIFVDGPPVFDRMPWAQVLRPHLDSADVILFNRGPHYTPMDQFIRGLTATSRTLREMYPQKLLVYRNTPPGHLNCTLHKHPLAARQEPTSLPYNWGKFQEQNKKAREIVEALGIVYMDVDTMTGLRADGHKGFWPELNLMDCLHYCHPGPIDTWVELFLNLLRQLRVPTHHR